MKRVEKTEGQHRIKKKKIFRIWQKNKKGRQVIHTDFALLQGKKQKIKYREERKKF